MLAEGPPYVPRLCGVGVVGAVAQSEVGQRDAVGVQEAGDVVVGVTSSDAGSVNASSSASRRASTCPCGLISGRSRTLS
ncbi:hypothetical protein ACFQ0O_25795 [Saccharopolyspora spinosporotrichia]